MTYKKTVELTNRYLHLPVRDGARMALIHIAADGELAMEFVAELDGANPDFWVYADMGEYVGRSVEISVQEAPEKLSAETKGEIDGDALKSLRQGDEPPEDERAYNESLRPQFHFSSYRGWNNDPNGLMFYKGEYHLFYQHNPFGWKWGNMHWGHAISRDLVYWTETGEALYPDKMGTMFSGSGVVDGDNSSDFQIGTEKALICIYTAAGGTSVQSQQAKFTQCIAYSTDGGKSWQKYDANPVVDHIAASNRDPKVIWHEPTKRWIMAIYLDNNDYTLLSSTNLKSWERVCEIAVPGASECPDIFELPVDGERSNTRWVFWGASGNYLIGQFDGSRLEIESGPHRFQYGTAYAAQTWSDIPDSDGRRIQIAWLRGDKPDMPFNQQMTFPCELQLRSTDDGIRMFSHPVRELAILRSGCHELGDRIVQAGALAELGDFGELLDVRCDIKLPLGDAGTYGIDISGTRVCFDAAAGELSCVDQTAPISLHGGSLSLQVLVDRSSIEIFVDGGAVAMAVNVGSDTERRSIRLFSKDAKVEIKDITIYELKSIWP